MLTLIAALVMDTETPVLEYGVSRLQPVTIQVRFEPSTKTIGIWNRGELVAEYERQDGEVYRKLVGILEDCPSQVAKPQRWARR